MSELLVQLAVGNLLASAGLGVVAYLVHRRGRYPSLAHLAWVVVLLKLVSPPVLMLPVAPSLAFAAPVARVVPESGFAEDVLIAATGWLPADGTTLLLLVWALGSIVVGLASIARIARFHRLLAGTSGRAPAEVHTMAEEVARGFGMRRVPQIRITESWLSPLTWWIGRRVHIVLPLPLTQQLTSQQLRWVLAHELAHVRRHDHVIRWLEWLACVAFWWNPVAWWARRHLREDEEASCDAFVLERLESRPRAYADALLAVVEVLSQPALRPPAIASGIDGAASLERRFARMAGRARVRRAPRSLRAGIVLLALLLLPLGLGQAGGHDAGDAASTPGPVAAALATTGSAPAESGAVRFLPTSASLRAAAGERDARAIDRRLQQRLEAAARSVRRAERAIRGERVTPASAEISLREARTAVRRAARALEDTDPSARELRELRELRGALRRATARWREAVTSR